MSNFSSEEITYDANGNQLIATDWLGNTITNVFDPLNRLVEKRDAYDLSQETYFYDESSRQIAAEDVMGRRTTYEYDCNNRLVLTVAPDGYTVAQTYDRRGNVIAQTDALGNTTHYAYDYLGRLVSVIDALDQTTTYTYDLKGNLLSQTDSAGNTTYLEYNCRDLLLRKVSPGGRTGEPGAYIYAPTAVISYTYDALGNTATRTDRSGNTTVFEWDVHGNLLSQAIGSNEISYTYDSNGNVLTMTDSLGTTTRVYDEFNRCISKTVPIIGTSSYVYDLTTGLPAGHVVETTTDPKGNVTLREYDRAGRLVRVTDTAVDATAHTVLYTYNDNGNVASVIYPDGAREDYTYTAGNLLSTLTNTLSNGTVLETYVYTYDLARNLLNKQDAKGTTSYTTDPLGRVLSISEPSGKRTEYTFDGSGNRATQTVTETIDGGAISIVRTTYTYDVRNRLTSLQKHDISDALLAPILVESTEYTYDFSGNQLQTTRTTYTDGIAGAPVVVQSNTYDVWNQLIRTVTENGTIVENAYNGDGRRVVKTVNGASTYYLYEYDKVILETNVFGDVTGRNVYGLNLLIRTVGIDTFYYMYNGHADVTALLTPTGTVATSYYYDAFGNILEQTGDVSNSILFAGYQFDKETGLYYLNARMYDPVTARFMQEDTYAGQQRDPLSLNLYTYCHNSPLMYFDPTGHWSVPQWLKDAGDWVADTASDAWETTKEVAGKVLDTVSDAWDKTKEVASNVANKAADLWTATTNTVLQYIDKAKEAAKTFVDTTGKVVDSAIDDGKNVVSKINDKVVQPIKNTVAKVVKDVKEKATEIVESGKQLVVDAFTYANETVVGKFLYNLGESTVNTAKMLKEDWDNYDPNNQDPNKILNSNFFSSYQGTPVFWLPMGNNAFSYGAIFLGDGKKDEYKNTTDINKFMEIFMKTVNHEQGHRRQFDEMGLFTFTYTVALPSVAHCQLDDITISEMLKVGRTITRFNPTLNLPIEIAEKTVGASPNLANSKIFDLMGWSAYNSYYEKPYEYDADVRGGVTRTGADTVNIHAEEWRQTYFDANILERMYYFFDPQKLFQDSEEENWYSYTREEYQNQT